MQRLQTTSSIRSLQKWVNQGGQMSWWEIQTKPLFPPQFSSMRSLIDFQSLPPLPPAPQTAPHPKYFLPSGHSRKLVDFQRSYHPHFAIYHTP